MEEMQETGQTEASPKLDVGATLREAREAHGISVEEVAVRIKFAPRQIEALEENRWDELPEIAFIRGFVRSYARLLELDHEALLAAMPGGHPKPAAPVRHQKEDVVKANAQAFRQNLIWLAGGLMVAVAVIVLAWKYNAGEALPTHIADKPELTATAESVAEQQPASKVVAASQPAAASEQTTAPVVAEQPASPRQAVLPAKPATKVKPQVQALTDTPAVQTPQPSASEVAAARAVPLAQRGPSQQVRLEFDEDSWVELYDGSGKTLLSTLGKAGGTLRATGPTPLTLTIGHVKGVHLFYKGQPLELNVKPGRDVVKLKLE